MIWRYALTGAICVVLTLLASASMALVGVNVYRATHPEPNAVDIGFCQDMAVHHSQALLMAQIVLDSPDASLPVRQLAAQIQAGQAEEIGIMHGWLRLWNAPPISAHPMRWMSRYDLICSTRNSLSPMPGLATVTEIQQLSAAHGLALDRLFIKLMLNHHYGGVGMMQAALQGAAVPQVRDLIRGMMFDQMQEIAYMRQMDTLLNATAPNSVH